LVTSSYGINIPYSSSYTLSQVTIAGFAGTSALGKKFDVFQLMQYNSAIKRNRTPTYLTGNTLGSAGSMHVR